MDETTLSKARNIIDKIDKDMVTLFELRMNAVEAVVRYKLSKGLPVLDSSREQAVIDKNSELIEDEKFLPHYKDFISAVMEISKQYQRCVINKSTMGYQGTEGSFSHIALTSHFGSVYARAYETFGEVFDAVSSGEISCGVVPFENSYAGEVSEVLDLLFKSDCFISSFLELKINHCLLGVKGAKLSDIKTACSHSQALAQCKEFLDRNGITPSVRINTAIAAREVAGVGDKSIAAIASLEAAELYGLVPLAKEINTSDENATRFILLIKKPPYPIFKEASSQVMAKAANGTDINFIAGALGESTRGADHFCIMFTLGNTPGKLAKAVAAIGRFGFNMESIHSMPLKESGWQYYFYSEIEGDPDSEKAQELFAKLTSICATVKVVGKYKKEG